MTVDSYFELFTTLYGWLFYNIIWDVMVTSGIALLPFIGIVIDNVLDAYKSNDHEEAAGVALKGIEVEVIIAFIVITLAGNPFFTFEATAITYTPPAILGTSAAHGTISAADNSESTFATISFAGHPPSVDVPPWWYGVIQLSSGISRAIIEGIPPVLDYRNYMTEINTMAIEDTELREEVNDFYRDCYLKARSRYYEENPTSSSIDSLLSTYGEDDPDWIGSHVYLSTPGFYDSFRAEVLVSPFPYDSLRDVEWDIGAGDVPPTYGRPYCDQWWSGIIGLSDGGLKEQIVSEVSGYDALMAIYETGISSVEERQDVMIRKLLSMDANLAVYTPRGYDMAYQNRTNGTSSDHAIEGFAKSLTTAAGATMMGAVFGIFLDIFLRSATMVQSYFLMGIVTLLPIALIVSRYRLSILMAGAMAWFSVKFWTVLWFIVFWFDQNLIIALFPDPGSLTLNTLSGGYNNRVILNVVSGLMYLMLPVLFTMMMSLAGYTAGRQLDAAKGMASDKMKSGSDQAGRLGNQMARKGSR